MSGCDFMAAVFGVLAYSMYSFGTATTHCGGRNIVYETGTALVNCGKQNLNSRRYM
jgi:hypothetical protein